MQPMILVRACWLQRVCFAVAVCIFIALHLHVEHRMLVTSVLARYERNNSPTLSRCRQMEHHGLSFEEPNDHKWQN